MMDRQPIPIDDGTRLRVPCLPRPHEAIDQVRLIAEVERCHRLTTKSYRMLSTYESLGVVGLGGGSPWREAPA